MIRSRDVRENILHGAHCFSHLAAHFLLGIVGQAIKLA